MRNSKVKRAGNTRMWKGGVQQVHLVVAELGTRSNPPFIFLDDNGKLDVAMDKWMDG